MDELIEMKKQYNALLTREKRAEKFFEIATPEEVEKWIPEFNKIVEGLSALLGKIPDMTQEEIFNGFKLN
jgi:hypothetical protein